MSRRHIILLGTAWRQLLGNVAKERMVARKIQRNQSKRRLRPFDAWNIRLPASSQKADSSSVMRLIYGHVCMYTCNIGRL